MKNKIFLFISMIIIASIYIGWECYNYYAPPVQRAAYHTFQHHDDTLRIAYIGDSWAFGHSDHQCVITKLLEDSLHIPVKIDSYGICGLTSKEIYYALFEIESFSNFMKKGYNFCFISAGINDTYKKMSTTYYKQSINCIINFLLSNNIYPIILDIPDYNINLVFDRQTNSKKLLRKISMLINDVSLDCKQQFRDALNELIENKIYGNKVSILHYKSWNNNYINDLNNLYIEDGMHLNNNGYTLLDSLITKTILQERSIAE